MLDSLKPRTWYSCAAVQTFWTCQDSELLVKLHSELRTRIAKIDGTHTPSTKRKKLEKTIKLNQNQACRWHACISVLFTSYVPCSNIVCSLEAWVPWATHSWSQWPVARGKGSVSRACLLGLGDGWGMFSCWESGCCGMSLKSGSSRRLCREAFYLLGDNLGFLMFPDVSWCFGFQPIQWEWECRQHAVNFLWLGNYSTTRGPLRPSTAHHWSEVSWSHGCGWSTQTFIRVMQYPLVNLSSMVLRCSIPIYSYHASDWWYLVSQLARGGFHKWGYPNMDGL